MEALPGPRRVLPLKVQLNLAELELLDGGILASGTPQLHVNTRHQFPNAERLRDVIVGPDFETNDLVCFLPSSGQHYDWVPHSSVPQFTADI
jgi:hypothetical protein